MKEFVPAGERRVGRGCGTLSVLGIGSCVVVALYDHDSRVGGVVHVLLPDPSFSAMPERRWRFATTAIPALLEEIIAAGAEKARVTARLVGGASMFQDLLPQGHPNIGTRNVEAARAALEQTGIPLVAEDTGGGSGRSIVFDLADGSIRITSAARGHVEI